jgi:hypothetical protein
VETYSRTNSLFSSSTAGGATQSSAHTSVFSDSYESRNNSKTTRKKMSDVQEMEVLEETTSVSSKTASTRPKYKNSADDVFCEDLSSFLLASFRALTFVVFD